MAKFFGVIGYATGNDVEIKPGVWGPEIIERKYYGDVIKNSRGLESGDKINDDITVNNSISVVADPYAREHFFAMKYVKWAGVLWVVSNVDVQFPRLILRLGGVYNGPTP